MTLRNAAAVAILVFVVPAATVIWDVRVDNRLERWQGSDTKAAHTYEDFKRTFGSDEFVLLALWDGPLLEENALAVMVDVADSIEDITGITRVAGIPVVYRDLFDSEDPDALAEEMLSTPFYRDLFISDDGLAGAIIATVEPPEDPSARHEIVRRVRDAASPLTEIGFTTGLVGPTVLIDALDVLSESESKRAFAVALMASLIALAIVSRSLRAMIVAGCCALASIILTMALVVITGHTLNMITSVLPALLWVLSLSGAIHLIRRYRHHRWTWSQSESMELALTETTHPMTLATLTTAAGFLSLVVARMEPVRELGYFAAAGILTSLAVNLSLGPLLIRLVRVPAAARAADPEFHGRWLHLGSTRPRLVIGVALVLIAGLYFLPAADRRCLESARIPTRRPPDALDYERVSSTLAGFYTLEVVVELPTPWTDPAHWPVIDRLTQQLNDSAIVSRTLSPLDLLRKLEHWYHDMEPSAYRLPQSRSEAEERLSELDEGGQERLSAMVSDNGRALRLSAMVNEMDEHRFLDLVASARTSCASLGGGVTGAVTGQVLLLVNAQQSLVSTQIRSLLLALVVVFAVIGVGLRFSRLTVLSAVPNVLPLLMAFAVMGIAGLALDAATVMVASIALGIAVDDTVHLLVAINRERGADDAAGRLHHALEHVAPALVLTTVAACIGFFSLTRSAFVPIKYFGLLAGIAMLTALVADLWLVPALLSVRNRLTDRKRR